MKDRRTMIIEATQHCMDGNINEIVEHRNLCTETLLRYLCTKKYSWLNHWGPYIDGGTTIEDLLQEVELTLATTAANWWIHETIRKNYSNMVVQDTDTVSKLWKIPSISPIYAKRMSRMWSKGTQSNRQCRVYNQACMQKIGSAECIIKHACVAITGTL